MIIMAFENASVYPLNLLRGRSAHESAGRSRHARTLIWEKEKFFRCQAQWLKENGPPGKTTSNPAVLSRRRAKPERNVFTKITSL